MRKFFCGLFSSQQDKLDVVVGKKRLVSRKVLVLGQRQVAEAKVAVAADVEAVGGQLMIQLGIQSGLESAKWIQLPLMQLLLPQHST